MSTKQILTRVILGIAFLLAVTAAAEAQTPSGSVAFETAEASAMGNTNWVGCTLEGAWRRVARARAQVPRSAARRVPVSAWPAQSPGAGGRQRGV